MKTEMRTVPAICYLKNEVEQYSGAFFKLYPNTQTHRLFLEALVAGGSLVEAKQTCAAMALQK